MCGFAVVGRAEFLRLSEQRFLARLERGCRRGFPAGPRVHARARNARNGDESKNGEGQEVRDSRRSGTLVDDSIGNDGESQAFLAKDLASTHEAKLDVAELDGVARLHETALKVSAVDAYAVARPLVDELESGIPERVNLAVQAGDRIVIDRNVRVFCATDHESLSIERELGARRRALEHDESMRSVE